MFDQVPPGWSREGWIWRLRTLARRCRAIRPDLAADYEAWAAVIEVAAAKEKPPMHTDEK